MNSPVVDWARLAGALQAVARAFETLGGAVDRTSAAFQVFAAEWPR